MSSIAGFFSPEFRQGQRLGALEQTAEKILKSLSHRGPDQAYRMTTSDGVLMYNALYTNQMSRKNVPTQGKGGLGHLHIVCDDGIYNYDELASQLESQNISARNMSRPDILLTLYHLYGERFATLLRGGYAIAIADVRLHKVVLFRDPMGVKPLFYHQQKDLFLFASEIKGSLPIRACMPAWICAVCIRYFLWDLHTFRVQPSIRISMKSAPERPSSTARGGSSKIPSGICRQAAMRNPMRKP